MIGYDLLYLFTKLWSEAIASLHDYTVVTHSQVGRNLGCIFASDVFFLLEIVA